MKNEQHMLAGTLRTGPSMTTNALPDRSDVTSAGVVWFRQDSAVAAELRQHDRAGPPAGSGDAV